MVNAILLHLENGRFIYCFLMKTLTPFFFLINYLSFSVAFAQSMDHTHKHTLGKIEIIASADESSLFDKVQNVTTLSGDELLKVRGNSLGETLKNEVGITSTSYGPNTSRPVIRGLDGERIRILQNGLGVLDASGASQDHAVPIDPLLMDSVEIVRGPLSLLYGSSAVGGVVNVITNRTHNQFEEGFHSAIDTQLTSVDNGKTAGFKADYGVSRWMLHADGNFRDSQDYKINGFARSERLREINPLPLTQEARDKQPNSANQTRSGGVGTTYVGEKGLLGFSASTYSSDYGVLVEPDVQISMEQSRFDLVGERKMSGFLRTLKLKSAQSIYKHSEIEGGQTGTTFRNTGNETRVEAVQNTLGNWSGLFGLQSNVFNFSALGDEAFLPKTENSAQALFLFEEYNFGDSKIDFGARAESNRIQPLADAHFSSTEQKSFLLGSLAVGYLYTFSQEWSLSTQTAYSERAPNYQELFANGAHVATFTYQVGDAQLTKEKVSSIELSLRHKKDKHTLTLTVFGQKFRDYIALNPTGLFDDTDQSGTAGDSLDDLPIYNYLSQDAAIYGAEFDSRWNNLNSFLPGSTDFYFRGDYLRGKNTVTGNNLPRMTPPRVSVGATQKIGSFSGDLELQQVFSQNETAPNELATDGFLQVNAGIVYKKNLQDQQYSLFLRANNLFNVEARNHVSILKDLTQMGGRNVMFGVRAYF